MSITKPEEGNASNGTVAYSTAKSIWPYLYLSDIANFKVRSDDVYLLSYAKSGTYLDPFLVSTQKTYLMIAVYKQTYRYKNNCSL